MYKWELYDNKNDLISSDYEENKELAYHNALVYLHSICGNISYYIYYDGPVTNDYDNAKEIVHYTIELDEVSDIFPTDLYICEF